MHACLCQTCVNAVWVGGLRGAGAGTAYLGVVSIELAALRAPRLQEAPCNGAVGEGDVEDEGYPLVTCAHDPAFSHGHLTAQLIAAIRGTAPFHVVVPNGLRHPDIV